MKSNTLFIQETKNRKALSIFMPFNLFVMNILPSLSLSTLYTHARYARFFFIDRVRVTHARQYTYFFNTKSHTAYPDFQTDARGSEANLPSPGVRSAFQDVLHLSGLIPPSLFINH
jgi:hypothetical protein